MKVFVLLLFYCEACKSWVIDCSFRTYSEDESHIYSCFVTNRQSDSITDFELITDYRGQHKEGKTDDDVKYFESYGRLHHFPKNITNLFKNIQQIALLSPRAMSSITKYDLEEFGENLTGLYIINSKIEIIQSDLFEFTPNVKKIWLCFNRIKIIEWRAFDNLQNLKTFLINRNPCTSSNDLVLSNRKKVLDLIRIVEAKCNLFFKG